MKLVFSGNGELRACDMCNSGLAEQAGTWGLPVLIGEAPEHTTWSREPPAGTGGLVSVKREGSGLILLQVLVDAGLRHGQPVGAGAGVALEDQFTILLVDAHQIARIKIPA